MTTLHEAVDDTATDDTATDDAATDDTAVNGTTPDVDTSDDARSGDEPTTARIRKAIAWRRVLAFGLLPGITLLLALTAGYLKWVAVSGTEFAQARTESVRVAGEDAVALLTYHPDSAEQELNAARDRLTGEFRDAYTALIRGVVIPGAKEKRISAVAKVSAASSVSATANHAVVLLFVNQTTIIGEGGTPTDTQPVIRVILEKVDGRWLVSHFDPV